MQQQNVLLVSCALQYLFLPRRFFLKGFTYARSTKVKVVKFHAVLSLVKYKWNGEGAFTNWLEFFTPWLIHWHLDITIWIQPDENCTIVSFLYTGSPFMLCFLNLALTDRNIQARFGLRVVWESWVVALMTSTASFHQKTYWAWCFHELWHLNDLS